MDLVTVNGSNDDFNLSSTIWGKCPIKGIREGRIPGVILGGLNSFATFNKTPATTEGNWAAAAGYAQFSGTGGAITAPALSAATGAGLPSPGITIGSDDDAEGVSLRTLSVPFAINRAAQDFWFECRIKKSSIADTIAEVFVGLLENVALTSTVPITNTAATLSDNNMVGFYSTESDGDHAQFTYKANGVTAVAISETEVTFVADTYTKLGFRFIRRGDKNGAYCLNAYQDGVKLASYKQIPDSNGTDFPTDVAMGLCVAIRNAAGSSPGTATLQWWQAAQLYAPLL